MDLILIFMHSHGQDGGREGGREWWDGCHIKRQSIMSISFTTKVWSKRALTMVSTCLRGRSLLGACLEKTEENKGGVRTCSISKTHCFGMSLPHLLSLYVQATLSTIPCPNVAWSRVAPHLGCVGPSIIPLCKYLHKIDKSPCNSQKRVQPWNSLFQSHIQLWPEREDQAKRDESWRCRNRR